MPDPTGGMFEARLALEDETSETLDDINDRIEKAVEGTENLQDELDGLYDKLDRLHKKSDTILDKTNDLGVLGSSMFGILGKGNIKDQFEESRDQLGLFSRFLAGPVAGALLEVADAGFKAADAVFTLYTVITGKLMLAQLPRVMAASNVETIKMIATMEDLRHTIKLTSAEAASMARDISRSMFHTTASIEKTTTAFNELLKIGALQVGNIEEIASATVYMSDAWGMAVENIVQFNRELADMYQAGRGNILGVASAMDYVARTTSITREELMGVVSSLKEDLLFKIPQDLRSKVMPKMLADISALAGAWKDAWGTDARFVTDLFSKFMDVFDEQGHRARGMIVKLGGATEEELQKAFRNADISIFQVGLIKAVKNLKKELGDPTFTQIAGFYADQLGITRNQIMKIGESADDMLKRIEAANKEMMEMKSIREAWDRARGVFNNIWKSIENIGRALLITFGEPYLRIFIPFVEWIDKALQNFVDLFKHIDEGDKKTLTLAATFASLWALIEAGMLVWAKFGVWLAKKLGPKLAWLNEEVIKPLVKNFGRWLLKIVLITAAFYLVAKAVIDWGGALVEGLMPALEKLWGLIKVIGVLLLLYFAPVFTIISLLIYAVTENWETFYKAVKPGLDALKLAWNLVTQMFKSIGESISEAFGTGKKDAEKGGLGIAKVLEVIAAALGYLISGLAYQISAVVYFIGFFAKALSYIYAPTIAFIGGIRQYAEAFFNVIKLTIEAVLVFFGLMSGDSTALGAKLKDALKDWIKALIRLVTAPFDAVLDVINEITKGLNYLLPESMELGTIDFTFAGALGGMVGLQAGGITTADTPAMLHKNEVVMPLDKLPEVIPPLVNINMQEVVDELKALRSEFTMLRRGSATVNKVAAGAL